MSRAAFDRLAAALGDTVSRGADQVPRVAPRSADEMAAALGIIHREGWTVAIEGRGTWARADAPADVRVSTRALDQLVSVAPSDLVATAQAGIPLDRLAARLGAHRTWLAIDPPGASDRSLGGILATGTSGPIRHRFGPIRDHVLGTTIATIDGRLVRSGGVVVKNVAGYDLSKIQVGGFGGFGVIVEVNLRLRATPAARRTLVGRGDLDTLFLAARRLVDGNLDAAAIELVSPGASGGGAWLLGVLLTGTAAGVAAEATRAATLAEIDLGDGAESTLGSGLAPAFIEGPVTLRVGALPPSIPDQIELIQGLVGPGAMTASPGVGGIRWCGTADHAAIRRLRAELAAREVPLTLERAPWPIRSAVGHYGAFREGVRPLTARVRAVFDPEDRTISALEEPDHG